MSRDGSVPPAPYARFAVLVVNSLLVFLALNLVLYLAWAWHDSSPRSQLIDLYGLDRLAPSHPDLTREELRDLLIEDNTTSEYEPFTQFRPKPKEGRFVSVTPEGFRRVADQGPWPPARGKPSVFFFGGSTAFGSGVPDGETIASQLQAKLRASGCREASVYNFGRPDYISSQEGMLFTRLAVAGETPDVAIFLDGLNDFAHYGGKPAWTERLGALVEEAREPGSVAAAALQLLHRSPFGRTADLLARRLGRAPPNGDPLELRDAPPFDDEATLHGVIDRWISNKRVIDTIARGYGTRALYVWQPVPTYKYDLSAHALARGELGFFRGHQRSHWGYALAERLRPALGLGPDVLWLDAIQEGRHENLYVDGVHYTAAFSGEIAGRIAARLTESGTLACAR